MIEFFEGGFCIKEDDLKIHNLDKLYVCKVEDTKQKKSISIVDCKVKESYILKFVKDFVFKKDGKYFFYYKTNESTITDIKSKLDYSLKYADERNSLVTYLLIKNDKWLSEVIGSESFKTKQVKNKKSFLSEGSNFEASLSEIVDYISIPQFYDEEKYKLYKEKKKEYNYYKSLNLRDYSYKERELIKDKIYKLKKEMDSVKRNDYEYKEDEKKRNNKEKYYSSVEKLILSNEKDYKSVTFNFENKKGNYVEKKRKILTKEYWDKMFPINDYGKKFRIETYNSYIEDLMSLKSLLGIGLSKEEKDLKKEKLLKELRNRIYFKNGKKYTITPEYQYFLLDQMYKTMMGNLQEVTRILTSEIPSNDDSEPAEFNYFEDTWYINENGEEVHVSFNTINFSNKDTYKGLLKNYLELKERSYEKTDSYMKWILEDLDNLIKDATLKRLTPKEVFIIECLKSDLTNKEIIDKYKKYYNKELSYYELTRAINISIPNKLLDTYLDRVQDWLVVNWQIGRYKVCSKCGEAKLANERYFGKHPRSKDGIQSNCKKCNNLMKK